MKFDSIIIGGGLSGLTCGISLAKAGKKVAIVAAGQSTLHFSSGSFDLLGYDSKGNIIENPVEAIAKLGGNHPYSKVGAENIESLASAAEAVLTASGLKVKGNTSKNHFRITPMGVLKPTWLTLEDYLTTDNQQALPYKKVILCNIAGFMDFPVEFIAEGLRKVGTEVDSKILTISALKERRMSPSEMRSANISKILSTDETLREIADVINENSKDADAVLLPAIVGMNNDENVIKLKSMLNKPMFVVATLPPSVPGVRVQKMLRSYFERLGGVFMLGNTVTGAVIDNGKVVSLETSALPDDNLYADNYVLATGSFQSEGLKSNYVKVFEPIFDLDVDAGDNRTDWIDENVYNAQPYMTYGVKTNNQLQTQKNGSVIENLYAIGSVLSGHNAIKQADGTGVSLITAVAVAKNILNM